ncbi:hypothetical protein G7046_g3224 [Stylonectria norvegica]|nr:hypothetical protein G7046_g3224 [Stylonectria norvegica]
MIPKSENSLPSSPSDDSITEAKPCHVNTGSVASSKSNPFTASEDGDEIQLEDFSCIRAPISEEGSSFPKNFVSEHPSRPFFDFIGRPPTRKRSASLDDDKAISEWETVAPDDEFEEVAENPSRQVRRQRNFELVFHAQDILETSRNRNQIRPGRNTILLPPRSAMSTFPTKPTTFNAPRLSFQSSSSLYSDLTDRDATRDEGLLHLDDGGLETDNQLRRPPLGRNRHSEFIARCSRASSSTSGDPFKYDGDLYSGFLQPLAERDISDALHHIVASNQSKESTAHTTDTEDPQPPSQQPELVRRLSGSIVTLLRPRPKASNDDDWHTITTEQPFDSVRTAIKDSLGKGTGSSLADVSDVSRHEFYPREYGSTERIIQHPHPDTNRGSYYIRKDKQTNIPIFVPKFKDPDSDGFPQNSFRKAAGPRRFSNPFRRDNFLQKPSRESTLIEMGDRLDSYQSLDSDIDLPFAGVKDTPSTCPEKNARFRWSRIRENLGREPPKTPLTIFDQPLYRSGMMGESESNKSSHVPHDEFLARIPRLPFPLISLPEAAMLQYFRRERGEEDHTDPSGSFAAKGRSNTISTISSSTFPITPPSGRLEFPDSPRHSPPKPAPVHHAHKKNESMLHHDSPERIADILISSSGILDTPPSTDPRALATRTWFRGLPRDAAVLCEGLPRIRGFSSSTTDRRAKTGLAGCPPREHSLFTPSETDLIEMAREDILLRRRLAQEEDQREQMLFLSIMILTLLFPFIGLLALWGKFDSTVSWYTHGEMHSLTAEQRGTLKQQLFVEVVLYPVLIIILAVYYSVHR